MTEPNPQFDLSKAIRAQGEQDRTPELKEARQGFVKGINDFLETMAALQQNGETIRMPGTNLRLLIKDTPRIRHTRLGVSANGRTHSAIRNLELGASLQGDGEFSPRTFQAVIPHEQGGRSVIEITGTDPMLPKTEFGDVEYAVRNQGVTASLSVESSTPTEDGMVDTNESYIVQGTGAVSIPRTNSGFSQQAQVDGIRTGLMIVDQLRSDFLIK